MALSKLFTRRTQSGLTRCGGILSRNANNVFVQTRTAVTKIQETSDFENYVNTSVKLLVIDYKAEWCGPCKRMAPIFEELSNQYDDKCDFLSVDCDDLPELAAQRGVASLPTFELIKNGKALEQVIGANPSKLEQAIVRYLDE
eukprot:CAMPEP_0197055780 /NCGR_PEP_ID=MMETSP1384-20130603/72969_1 /TAXON_ID=29189 /ORGANISM="Ammonia sp." /LENGTH=142 /DNA_ID=CAMNT_0042489471 /DNA_START=39 /DNA_END=467 /DNA_ORIENTATION=+